MSFNCVFFLFSEGGRERERERERESERVRERVGVGCDVFVINGKEISFNLQNSPYFIF